MATPEQQSIDPEQKTPEQLAAERKEALHRHVIELSVQAVVAIALSQVFRLLELYGHQLYDRASRVIGPHLTAISIGLVITALGFGAHWFKGKNQRWYGLLEVVFGIVSGFAIAFAFSPGRPWMPQGASLVGAAYVIARGLNNVTDARKKEEAAVDKAFRRAVAKLGITVDER